METIQFLGNIFVYVLIFTLLFFLSEKTPK